MISGWMMLGLTTLICMGLFANGVRFARLREPFANLPEGGRAQLALRLYGRLAMVTAPILWLFFAAVCFGLFGPSHNFQPIQLH
jgi:hypothetical protein